MSERVDPSTPEELFAGHPLPLAVVDWVTSRVESLGDTTRRTSRSQVGFSHGRGFAYVWRPGQYLGNPDAEAVLTLVLGRADPSPRWKSVVHPSPAHWTHHLEVSGVEDLDDEVVHWLEEAWAHAADGGSAR